MMHPPENKTALITGASSGIGEAFARQLSASGYDLVLVARREEVLRQLADELERQHSVGVEVLAADLATAADTQRVGERISQIDSLEILVNNAGFGLAGSFRKNDVQKHLEMIQVHVIASVQLAHAAIPGMVARKQGAIINVSSVAAFIPWGGATYCATKAYLVAFSEALDVELRRKNVHVQALCPGFTVTEFHDSPELSLIRKFPLPNFLWLSSDFVVRESLKALKRNKVICIPGFVYQVIAFMGRSGIISPILRSLARRIRKA
jgi:uncharacterized protein